jgi:hypothetical protein
MTLFELAHTIADETGLERPTALFEGQDGDLTARRIVRAVEWLCKMLVRDYDWPGIEQNQVGKDKYGKQLKHFLADTDIPWPNEEIVIQGAVYRIRQQDGLADRADWDLLCDAIIDIIWRIEPDEPYGVLDPGMPGWRRRCKKKKDDGLDMWEQADW